MKSKSESSQQTPSNLEHVKIILGLTAIVSSGNIPSEKHWLFGAHRGVHYQLLVYHREDHVPLG